MLFPGFATVQTLIFFLFFYYLFGSIAGPSWNSWMKDLVPEETLGAYFSKRSRYTQTLNVVLSIVLALFVDFMKDRFPQYELTTYSVMFITAGVTGIIGALVLSGVQEPQSYMTRDNIFKLLLRPLKDSNFYRSLVFNSAWVFALNIATPFFKVLHLVSLHDWNFLFLIGAFIAFIAVEMLAQVKEVGEVERGMVRRIMRSSIKNNLKDYFLIGNLISLHDHLWAIIKKTLS